MRQTCTFMKKLAIAMAIMSAGFLSHAIPFENMHLQQEVNTNAI